MPADAVEVGRIVDAWGVKGWVKIQPYSADPQALFSCKQWLIAPPLPQGAGEPASFRLLITQARDHSDAVVASSAALQDRAQAQALKGWRVFVPRSSFPTAAHDEFYWVDLLGLDVVNREGVALGRIAELLAAGPQTVLVLQDDQDGQTVQRMIPFVAAFVDKVDLQARRVQVDWQPDY